MDTNFANFSVFQYSRCVLLESVDVTFIQDDVWMRDIGIVIIDMSRLFSHLVIGLYNVIIGSRIKIVL